MARRPPRPDVRPCRAGRAVTHPGCVLNGRRRIVPAVVSAAAVAAAAVAVVVTMLTAGHAPHVNHDSPVNPAAPQSGPWAAPYYYLGAGGPSPVQVMAATGIRRFTLAFVVSDGSCRPAWENGDPPTGGAQEAVIRDIRAAGGDVSVSFGGMGGTKLAVTCTSPEALAAAYQQVISHFRLRAIDLDAEDTEITTPAVRQRMVSALSILRRNDPGLMISVTIAAEPDGLDSNGRDLIARAAADGLRVDAWTIMPFDFSVRVPDMGQASVRAAEGLKNELVTAYHEPPSAAYRTMGISSMNGRTDTGETVSVADFQAMLRYARAHHLARFTFWSINRDRPCGPGAAADSCSGIARESYAFSRIIAAYRG